MMNLLLPPRYGHPASGLGNDGRRKRLKLQPQSFIPLLTQGSASSPDFSSGACAADLEALTLLSNISSKP